MAAAAPLNSPFGNLGDNLAGFFKSILLRDHGHVGKVVLPEFGDFSVCCLAGLVFPDLCGILEFSISIASCPPPDVLEGSTVQSRHSVLLIVEFHLSKLFIQEDGPHFCHHLINPLDVTLDQLKHIFDPLQLFFLVSCPVI